MLYLVLSILLITFLLYKRYFPVFGVHHVHLKDIEWDKINAIDIRDFHESYNQPIRGAITIPIAYLRRNGSDIPKGELHVIASNPLERNMGIRCLRKKGYRVTGYSIINHQTLLLKECS